MSNAASPLTIPTYNEDPRVVHPAMVYVAAGWNGYKYWMCFHPYKDLAAENPSIVVSNDKDAWIVPDGLTNPVVPNPGVDQYNSDVDIVIAQDNSMYMFWRDYGVQGNHIWRKGSSDGITWSESVEVVAEDLISPAVTWDGTQYVMYYCNNLLMERRTCATIDGTWSAGVSCPLVNQPASTRISHVEVEYIDGWFRAIIMTADYSDPLGHTKLYYGHSLDGINFYLTPDAILSASASGWDNGGMYRGSAVWVGQHCDLFYSAFSSGAVYRIGRTEFTLLGINE